MFSEPQTDDAWAQMPEVAPGSQVFAVEFLPGQFDQRADSASECIQLISQGERPTVRSAKVYVLEGDLTPADVDAIKHYVICLLYTSSMGPKGREAVLLRPRGYSCRSPKLRPKPLTEPGKGRSPGRCSDLLCLPSILVGRPSRGERPSKRPCAKNRRRECVLPHNKGDRHGSQGCLLYTSCKPAGRTLQVESTCYSLSPAVIWVAESSPSEAAAASGHTQPVKAGWS